MSDNRRYDQVIVRDRRSKIVCNWSSGPLTTVEVDGRQIIKTGLWATEIFIPSDEHSVEVRRETFLVPILFFGLAVIACGICLLGLAV